MKTKLLDTPNPEAEFLLSTIMPAEASEMGASCKAVDSQKDNFRASAQPVVDKKHIGEQSRAEQLKRDDESFRLNACTIEILLCKLVMQVALW